MFCATDAVSGSDLYLPRIFRSVDGQCLGNSFCCYARQVRNVYCVDWILHMMLYSPCEGNLLPQSTVCSGCWYDILSSFYTRDLVYGLCNSKFGPRAVPVMNGTKLGFTSVVRFNASFSYHLCACVWSQMCSRQESV